MIIRTSDMEFAVNRGAKRRICYENLLDLDNFF
jgi:hypothetical protein